MKKEIITYKIVASFMLILWGIFSLVAGQYYYFDAGTTPTYPYQQWCSEQLYIYATMESNPNGALAWLLSLQLDPIHFSYFTWAVATDLATYLFVWDSSTFMDYVNPSLVPLWEDPGVNTILHTDRINNMTPFLGVWRYGTLKFNPKYSASDYTGTVSIIYNGDTLTTSLSYWGVNTINSAYQYANLTWYYYVYQKPCIDDTNAPTPAILVPTVGTRKSSLSGISVTLLENVGVGGANVPYVRTGGLPGIGTWTGNAWSIINQYGVNLSTFQLYVSWNGTGKYFVGGMFSPSWPLAAVPSNKSWQFRDRDYAIDISWFELFYYGIEQTITITGTVTDRNGNATPIFSRIFNQPVGPWMIPWSANPSAGAQDVLADAPVIIWIQDDRAGVDSWSIVIVLSWINWTNYGPYIFTGTSLNLSGILWTANQPDYSTTISGHVNFPTSWTIHVSVYAEDMENNVDTINDYIFNTKPSCTDLGCCQNVYLQTGFTVPSFLYSWFILNVSWGVNPTFTFSGNTGLIDCNIDSWGLDIYKWIEYTWIFISFFDLPDFILSGNSGTVKALLSGQTLYLQTMQLLTFMVKAFPSNRITQATNNSNTWVLKFYDMNKQFVKSSVPFTLNAMGTGEVTIDITWGTYYVVFKGQSHLISYLSGITLVPGTGDIFDFTTGADLSGAQNINSQQDDGYRYQTAGDLKSSAGVYDHVINGNDISIILYVTWAMTFPQYWVSVLDPRDLNGDNSAWPSDLSVIGSNALKSDSFAPPSLGGIFSWFAW
ncbi:MAG: hypothetical protein ACD_80C00142G0021 [uncultured bacterium (gcode 4)]|uniref:Uncharacterized protein n=1 Tax=uncultured bacterium (gcode 4) TaxID=1234023 RepID=K1YHY8_9BACT|nr:MAG: hypothetical protein ACD_80C00142G0021 [uncultured bacterium (gcode 4)]